MSIFQQVNERAEAIKAAKRARYVPLPLRALKDSPSRSRVTIKMSGRTMYMLRGTEMQANDLARRGEFRGMQIFEFRRFGKEHKRCAGCGLFKLKVQFSPDERNADGLHSACKKCRAAAERRAYEQGRRKKRRNKGTVR